jgi:uncharacterized membrane protein
MSEQPPIPQEDIIYHRAIQVLRAGFAVSAVLLIAGIVWSLVEREAPGARVLPFRDLPGAIRDGDPASIIDLGILAMMATPVVLVFIIAWEFNALRERRFVTASLLVLAVLVTSIAISLLR